MSAAAALDATHWRSVFDSCDAALLVVDSAGLVQEANPAALALFRFDRADMQARVAQRRGECFGKAGAYAIQGRAAAFVAHLSGSHSGVMGLPLHETARLLRDFGLLA